MMNDHSELGLNIVQFRLNEAYAMLWYLDEVFKKNLAKSFQKIIEDVIKNREINPTRPIIDFL